MANNSEVTAPKQSLLAIVQTLEDLWALAESAETDEERDAAESEIARVVGTELATKVDSIGWFERRNEAEIALAKQMKADIDLSIRRRERRMEQVREMVQMAMERIGVTKIKGGMFTASIRQGSEHVEVTDMAALPLEYCRISVPSLSVDKAAIKRDLKNGEIPGARLDRGPSTLSIR
jgi:hypothetical protein